MTHKELKVAIEAIKSCLQENAPGMRDGLACMVTIIASVHAHCVSLGKLPEARAIENTLATAVETMRGGREAVEKANRQ